MTSGDVRGGEKDNLRLKNMRRLINTSITSVWLAMNLPKLLVLDIVSNSTVGPHKLQNTGALGTLI